MKPVILHIRRTHGWQDYSVQVPEGAYLLDALEAAGGQDPTLLYRHSCHHASCGSCGVRVNGREMLACITPLNEVTDSRGRVNLEPLRNFPLMGDLVVDYGIFMHRLDEVDMPPVRAQERQALAAGSQHLVRFENCIECGLCISACPIAGSDAGYAGPAILAAAGRILEEPRGKDGASTLACIDHEHGAWRCHAIFECSEVCPADVDPARLIFLLRNRMLG